MGANVYARNLEDESIVICPGDVFYVICRGKKIGTYQHLGLFPNAADGVYLLDIDKGSYVNVKLSWFNDKAVERLRRTACES